MAIQEKLATKELKWIDVTNPSLDEMEQLSHAYKLNQYMVRDCLQPEHLPKYEFDEDNEVHFLILRYYDQHCNPNISSIQELTNKIAIFSSSDLVITIHISETPFLEGIKKRASKSNLSTTELLSKIIWYALETFDDPANSLSQQLDQYESQVILKKTISDVTEALFYIKRQASISHKILMLMLEPINHIQFKTGGESFLQEVRDQHLKMQTLYGQALEQVNNLLSLSMSYAAQRTSEVMRILTIFSVFFMPLTFIVGIYGMNFEYMPELTKKWGYPAVLFFMAIVTGFIYWWFRKNKWL